MEMAKKTPSPKKPALTHSIYVIELDRAVLENAKFRQRNPDYDERKPCVYVGCTGKTPEERFEQHKKGHKANRYVKKHGLRLRPRHYERFNPMTYDTAKAMEEWRAESLRKKGYGVWWG